jgi:hypothetical protein
LKDFLVLDAQLAPLNVKPIKGNNDGISIGSLAEIGEGQAAEGALLVKMVVESIRGRNG